MARARQVGTRIRGVADLRPDPLFRRRGGGSKLPIRISGSRETPKFGLEVKRALAPVIQIRR
jgi:hypothetical protein